MSNSCKSIIDRMLHKGAMTQEEHDKVLRNLNQQCYIAENIEDCDTCGFCESSSEIPNRWIPFSEAEPEEDGRYLICDNYGYIDKAFYYDGDFNLVGITVNPVVAWMPLPEPYRGE